LIINPLTTSLLSLGNLLFTLFFIVVSLTFFRDVATQNTVVIGLYAFIVYLLVNILLQLSACLPLSYIPAWMTTWLNTLGIEKLWIYTPE